MARADAFVRDAPAALPAFPRPTVLTRRFLPLLFSALAALVVLHAAPARAQTPGAGEPDLSKVRIRMGPLSLNPSIALTNIGVDNNVFNEPDEAKPKSDFTFTLQPATDLWLHTGPTWVTGRIQEDLVWFQTYSSERSVNATYSAGWLVPLTRLRFNVNATRRNLRDRPGFEIDARSQRFETEYTGSIEVRTLSKTYFGLTAARQHVDFDKDAIFLNRNLQFELNRETTSAGATVRYQMTPLTGITLAATRSQDRFEFSSLRDSNSTAATASLNFDPLALIRGSMTVGYRDFEPLSPGLAAYKGLTASGNLSYVLYGSTKFTFGVNRDVQYSYDVNEPYYLLTAFTGSIAQQLFGPIDVTARAGVNSLAYRDRAGAAVVVSDRVDRGHAFGGGVGYHTSSGFRIGFDVDQTNRVSDISSRQYNDLRIGTSVTYVF